MAIDLLADEPIDLLAEEQAPSSFSDLSSEDQDKALLLAKQNISQKYPNMPEWLRDALLSLTPKNGSPMLESAGRGVSAVTNYIPAVAGGLLQGASLPIRGAASFIPNEYAQRFANSPDLSNFFQQAETPGQEAAQLGAELVGGGGLFGKLLGASRSAAQLARIPKALQTPAALAATGYIGTPGSQMDKGFGAGGALALGGLGSVAGKAMQKTEQALPAFFRGITSKSTPESLVEAVQKPHDKLLSTADELYGQVRSAIKKREIKIPIKEEHLNQIAEILPKTRANQKLIDKAKSGDYQAVHELQSHLYKKGTKGLSSDDIALENQGEEILDLRNKINEDLERHLITEGHTDIAHVLQQGKKKFKQIMDTYYPGLLRKGIGKMVHNDIRLVPENPESLFMENSKPMKEFLAKHPEVAKHVQGITEKRKATKALNSLLTKGAVAGGLTFGGKSLYDLFK